MKAGHLHRRSGRVRGRGPARLIPPGPLITGLLAFVLAALAPAKSPDQPPAVDQLIPWLLGENKGFREIPFRKVIFDTTGKQVQPVNLANPVDRRVIAGISAALDETLKQLNASENGAQNPSRINEASSHVEETLRRLLNARPDLTCDFPKNADGKIQRSGYPDLRIVDTASGRIFYLDPKLYAAGSRESSFRTFYFEPKVATNKVRDDAVHLVAGFEHEPRKAGRWNFTRWDLVDLAKFKVKLKAEFQGSNRDLYRPEATVATGGRR